MFKFWTRQQCEQFQIMHFGISCATCARSDAECPWHREDENDMTTAAELAVTSKAA